MNTNSNRSGFFNLDFFSVLFGVGVGVVGTLFYAAYRQREFDGLVERTRDIADDVGDRAHDLADGARQAASKLAKAARHGLSSAEAASRDVVEDVRATLK